MRRNPFIRQENLPLELNKAATSPFVFNNKHNIIHPSKPKTFEYVAKVKSGLTKNVVNKDESSILEIRRKSDKGKSDAEENDTCKLLK